MVAASEKVYGMRYASSNAGTCDSLVEPFLSGREFTVGILGTGPSSRLVGVTEHVWKKQQQQQSKPEEGMGEVMDFASRTSKSANHDTPLSCEERQLDSADKFVKAAGQVALDSWNVFGCRDAGRVDIRFDSEGPDGVPNVLEINPISGLLPGHSPLPTSAAVNGTSYEDLLSGIIESALERAYV